MTEFLKLRLLEPLGITSLTCSKCQGPEAVEMAGGGMRMTTEDMARFIYFVLNRGRWEGRQLLEEEWFDLACTKQIETAGDAEGHVKEWAYGYGFPVLDVQDTRILPCGWRLRTVRRCAA